MRAGVYFVVKTDLDPAMVTRLGLEIYAKWIDFASGGLVLGGKRLVHPTGRYARSIQFRQLGESSVAVIADEDVAPEAAILESGHGPVDLKQKLQRGRAYPMHRALHGSRPLMWAQMRNTGYASIGPNSPPDSWIIPAMSAYGVAANLARMAAGMARGSS